MAKIEIDIKAGPFPIHTVNQLAKLTGKDRNWLNNKTKLQGRDGETHLDIAYPFPNSTDEEDINTGPKFIVQNEKCERFIKKCKKGSL